METKGCYNYIKNSILHINKSILNNKIEINNNIQRNFVDKLEKSNNKKENYKDSLKNSVMLFKVSIRNRELLLIKWMENKMIPSMNEREEARKKLLQKCANYVDNGMKSNGKSFNERDLKSYLSYEQLDEEASIKKLEADYKSLYVYNMILNNFMKTLKTEELNNLSPKEIKEVFNTYKVEMTKASKHIMKTLETKESVDSKKIDKEDNNINKIDETKEIGILDENHYIEKEQSINLTTDDLHETQESNEQNNKITDYDIQENIDDISEVSSVSMKKKTFRKIAIMITLIIVGVGIGMGGVYISDLLKEKKNASIEESQDEYKEYEEYEEVTLDEKISSVEESAEDDPEDDSEDNTYSYENYELVDYDSAEQYYSIYTGAFSEISNAENYVNTLYNKGIKSTIVEEDDLYKVRVGSTYTIEEAKSIAKKIESKSVDTYILGYKAYYEDELYRMERLAKEGNMDAFLDRYIELKASLEGSGIFGRYLNKLEELYERYYE